MTALTFIYPLVNFDITIGLSLTASTGALAYLIARRRRRRKKPRPQARWQIDYESSTGLALRLSKRAPGGEQHHALPSDEQKTRGDVGRAPRISSLR